MKNSFPMFGQLVSTWLLFSFSTPVLGDILNFTGSVEVTDRSLVPSLITEGNWESDGFVRVFQEREKFILPTSVAIDINAPGLFGRTAGFSPSNARISENTEVDSFWIHFDPIGTPANMTRIGSITFDQDILGIIVGVNGGINQTHPDNTLGLSSSVVGSPGIGYDITVTDLFPGGGDQISLSADRRTIGFTLISGPGSDNMRVITAVPEPTTFTLLFTACMLLAIYRRNKQLTSTEKLLGAR